MAKSKTKDQAFIKRTLLRLADADMIFWLMPPIIVLLIAGTLAQRWLGLYKSIDLFFTSFIIWLGPLPLPGGFTLLGALSVCLLLKFTLRSDWSWKKSGIILAHLGALILLIGGLMTAIFAKEYYMMIPEGQKTNFIYHYTKNNLIIFEDDIAKFQLPYSKIKHWNEAPLPFSIDVQYHCTNCEIIKREESPNFDENETYFAMAQFMDLKPKPEDRDPEANLTGFVFKLTGTDQDGTYLAFNGMPKPIEITTNGKRYSMIFGKEQTALPFSLFLQDFVKTNYTGTNMAKSYHSDIILKDNGIEWPIRIEMNTPLRYKGYTFFQSSFEQTPETEMTILAVVKNAGWIIPYIGTTILGIGLLLHLLMMIRKGRKS